MNNGFIRVWRKLRNNPIYTNSKAVHIWIECLMRATYKDRKIYQGREKIKLKPGQFIMGYEEFAERINIPTSTVYFWLEEFQEDGMVKIKSNTKGTIVTINNWEDYQKVENEMKANEKREESNNKEKKGKKVKKENIPYSKIIDYLNQKADRKFKSTTDSTQRKIRARWNEGFNLDDFQNVIDTKVAEWKDDDEMEKYLRPKTLFSTKFEGYLNQPMPGSSSKKSTGPPTLDELDEDEKEAMGI